MNFLLLSSLLLLVPLAPAEPAPYAKFLFDDGYVLTESYDPREISHFYLKNLFYFIAKSNTSKYSDSMDIKSDLLKGSGGFAIEAYPRGPDFKLRDDICNKKSDVLLKPLIDDCHGNLIIRFLTTQERNQIRQYKDQQKVSKKPFEVTYDRKRTTIKSTEIAQLHYEDSLGWSDYHFLKFYTRINSGEDAHAIYLSDKLIDKSFVIEGLPADSKEKCGKVGLEDLDMTECDSQYPILKRNCSKMETSPKMTVESLNELPDDVLVLIFRRFDLLERLKLRPVCLRWKWIIEHLRIRDVSVVDSQLNRRKNWHVLGLELLNCQNLIYYSELVQPTWYQRLTNLSRSKKPTDSFQWLSNNAMFSRLKSMFISLKWNENFCFEKYINPHFQHLEQLSCFNMSLGKTSLSLRKLRVLSLFVFSRPNTRIRLELPSMYKFLTNLSLSLFQFTHPQSVTHLFSLDDHESIVLLSNLEYLSCGEFIFTNESLIFSNLLKLKEIHLRIDEFNPERFDEIYRAKQSLNRCNVKIFIGEVEYETYLLRPFLELRFKDVLSAYVSGKMRPSPVAPLNQIFVYDELLDAFGSQAIPSDLKSSFPFVRTIKASRTRDDVASFFSFLRNCPDIHILELESSFDGLADEQACYDSLPTCCKYLRELKMCCSNDRTTHVDLNFVLGFRFLQELEITQRIRSNFIQALFERIKYFRLLKMGRMERGQFSSSYVTIEKEFSHRYYLTVNDQFFILQSFAMLLKFYAEKVEPLEFAD